VAALRALVPPKAWTFVVLIYEKSSLYRHNPNHALDFHTDKNALRNSRKQVPLLTAFQEIREKSLSERERKLTEFEHVSSGS
jgi:hypothetical protein